MSHFVETEMSHPGVCAGQTALMGWFSLHQAPYVDDATSNSYSGCHGRAGNMGDGVSALAADEVAIGVRHSVVAWRNMLTVHSNALGASGLTPFESRFREDAVEALRFCLALDWHCPCNDPRYDIGRDLASVNHFGCGAKIIDTTLGAGSDEYLVNGRSGDGVTGCETGIIQGCPVILPISCRGIVGIGNAFADAYDVFGVDTQVTCGSTADMSMVSSRSNTASGSEGSPAVPPRGFTTGPVTCIRGPSSRPSMIAFLISIVAHGRLSRDPWSTIVVNPAYRAISADCTPAIHCDEAAPFPIM